MYTITFDYHVMPVTFDSLIEARDFIEYFLLDTFHNMSDIGDYTYLSVMDDGEIGEFEICSL